MHTKMNKNTRKGNILVLMCFLLPAVFAVAALTINLAYAQLARTELMISTDAAARAGGRALSELQDVDQALEVARITAAMNTVSGEALVLDTADSAGQVHFGLSEKLTGSERFGFEQKDTALVRSGTVSANAMRVTGNRMTGGGGPVQMPFPGFGLPQFVDLSSQSVAMQVDRDIALVLDRSGSMGWMTWDWPSGYSPWNYSVYSAAAQAGILYTHNGSYYYSSGQDSNSFQTWAWEQYYQLGDAPNTPWDDLVLAVGVFLGVLETTVQTEMVSLSSYSTSGSNDLPLQSNYQDVIDELGTLGPGGWTAIGLGMQAGVPTLYDTNYARPLAAKTVIVMTDGMHNTGIDPVDVAEDYVGTYDITIHTVTFSAGADQNRMQAVAEIGGGLHYHADTGAELIEVFREIANNLPTIITQ
ncbi:MAG: VWA domain-containing protein [Planctomycetota bacterium]|nr:VWA domain-containing protein [Planctomycetota bacterium]